MIGLDVILGGIVALILAVAAAFKGGEWRGAKKQTEKHKAEKANAYIRTDKAVDAARGSLDADANREWLRDRGQRKP